MTAPTQSLTDTTTAAPFRVLLYAHVDLNVVDGSAFFVAGAASLLTSAPGITVDVVTATPIKRAVVIQEMLVNGRVTVTDPFADDGLAARKPELRGISRLDEATAATMLDHYVDRGRYDVVLVRSTEVADALAQLRPGLGSRLCVYVTGVVAGDLPVEAVMAGRLQRLVDGGATLLCQTPEMREHLARELDLARSRGTLALMSPAVPAEPTPGLPGTGGPLVLAYTGKFAPAWNTVEMLAGFKEAASASGGLRLVVAGDHFKRPPGWPTFVEETRYLLGSHPDISWVSAVTRAEARSLVAAADVGLGWRSRELDESLELSTKLLEHGVLGRPCVINPTTMHQRLFGPDYPLFARSMPDYVEVLRRMARDRSLVRGAAEVASAVAQGYTYERVFREVFPALVTAAAGADADGDRAGFASGVERLVASGRRLVEHGGWVVAWLVDSRDAAQVLAHLGTDHPVRRAETWGPVVRWRAADDAGPEMGGVPALQLVVDVLADRGARRDVAEEAPPPAAVVAGSVSAPSSVAHDRSGRVTLAPPVAAPVDQPAPAGRPAGVPAPALAAEIVRQAQETERFRSRYEALSRSRLGRAQLAYWRLRSRVRRGMRRRH